MKKKLLITLLAILATLTCTLALTAFSCDDIFGNGKNTENNGGNSDNDTSTTPKHTHEWSLAYTEDGGRHYQTCSDCDEKKYSAHNYSNLVCDECGRNLSVVVGTEGLEYSLNDDEKSYSLIGVGTTSDNEITISSVYEGLPVISISQRAFFKCSSITSITIPDSVNSIGKQAFYYCTSLTSITIPDSVTSIGEGTFINCSSLESITIPDSVTSIGESPFINCSSLESITIPDSVTSIGESPFTNCYALTSITIPDSVTSIGNNAFGGCSSLTSITIPKGVTTLDTQVFSRCKLLSSITIPDSVTSIGYQAFYGCSSLTSITFEGTVAQWNAITKDDNWNPNTGDYTIHCTDGEIDKDGTVTMY